MTDVMVEADHRDVMVEADHRADVYREGDHYVFRASSLGNCLTRLIATGMGEVGDQPPYYLRKIWAAGSDWEQRVIANLNADEVQVTDCQAEVNMNVGAHIVRGHIDGIYKMRVLEIKSMSDPAFAKWEREAIYPPSYEWQISVYAYATGRLPTLLGVRRSDGKILMRDLKPPISRGAIVHKVWMCVQGIKNKQIPPCSGHVKNWWCPLGCKSGFGCQSGKGEAT